MKVFYFTATGNSLDVAKRFGGEMYSIPNDELKPAYGGNCEFCLACINLCPQKAIRLKKKVIQMHVI